MRPHALSPLTGALRCLVALAAVLLLLLPSGCARPRPWQGATPEQIREAIQHRNIGIAYLEGYFNAPSNVTQDAGKARQEFEALQRLQPGLGLGYANAAVAWLYEKGPPEQRRQAAERALNIARELLPNEPRLVLIRAKLQGTFGEQDARARILEEGARRFPNEPRIQYELVDAYDHGVAGPGEHGAQIVASLRRILEVKPENTWARLRLTRALAEQGDSRGGAAELERVLSEVAPLPPQAAPIAVAVRQALARGQTEAAAVSLRGLHNVLNAASIRFNSRRQELEGVSQDWSDLALREFSPPPPPLPPTDGAPIPVSFTDGTAEAGLAGVRGRAAGPGAPQFALGDVDTDGRAELDLGLMAADAPAPLLNQQGHFTAPAGASGPVGGGYLVDLKQDDNDALRGDPYEGRRLDLYRLTPTGDELLAGFPDGKWKPISLPAPLKKARGGSVLFVDFDQEGDLDLVRIGAAGLPPITLWRNNGNLTFTNITATSRVIQPQGRARRAVFADFDGDYDPELLLINEGDRNFLFENLRQAQFREVGRAWGIPATAGSRAAAVLDANHDGRYDVAVVGRDASSHVLYINEEGRRFRADGSLQDALGSFAAEDVVALDFDNDGWTDLLIAGKDPAGGSGVRLLRNNRGDWAAVNLPALPPAVQVAAYDYDQDGDPDLFVGLRDGSLRLLRNDGGNRNGWLRSRLLGKPPRTSDAEKGSDAYKTTNPFAIGSSLETLVNGEYQKVLITAPETLLGLGAYKRADVVRVTWTAGIPQNWIGVSAGHVFVDEQHISESCPFLYTWDGERFTFVSDCNWLSPLGMQIKPGLTIPFHQTRHYVRIAPEQMKPLPNGDLAYIVTEELREIAYTDHAELFAVDHPAGTEIHLDESMRNLKKSPPLVLHSVRHRRLPVSATNDRGEDLMPALRVWDDVCTNDMPPGGRRGYRRLHDLILELGSIPDPNDVRLFLVGWIVSANSSTQVSSSQNPRTKHVPPRMYVAGGRGGWQDTGIDVGIPAGIRKVMVFDLSGRFPSQDHRVKITTTMEIYWDAAWFVSAEAPVPTRLRRVPLRNAELRYHGFSRPVSVAFDAPLVLFDYDRVLPQPTYHPVPGRYTRYGDVTELVRAVDDTYVISGPGEEVRFFFDGSRLPALPEGWIRTWVMSTDGWSKDHDPNTLAGDRVEPLPFHAMRAYPPGPGERFPDTPAIRRWLREYQTRVVTKQPGGYPLAATR
ncbi:MAG: VCBS repeat-containing protein [Armatimonadetes bacterium]|nr:VCBS repeat-containing protein [Armatimonadota bacterium]